MGKLFNKLLVWFNVKHPTPDESYKYCTVEEYNKLKYIVTNLLPNKYRDTYISIFSGTEYDKDDDPLFIYTSVYVYEKEINDDSRTHTC